MVELFTSCPIDKKSLSGRHRPAWAESMPKPAKGRDVMVGSLSEAQINVKITTRGAREG